MKLIALLFVFALMGASQAGLSSDISPLMALLAPLLGGIDIGLQHGAGHLKAAVQNVGAGLDQAANAAADIAANTAAGLGQTVSRVPSAVIGVTSAIDRNKGLVGSVDHTVFGR